jgi:AcrR family transcriptional regulator
MTKSATDDMPAYKRARRKRIVDAAQSALERNDFEQIRINDVAHEAGVALGTLYRYFSSKEHLYAVALQDWLTGIRVDRPVPGARPEDRIRARVRAVISAFERQPRYFKLNVLLYGSTEPEVKPILTQISSGAQHLLTRDFQILGPDMAQDTATMLWSIIYTQLTAATHHEGTFAEAHRLAEAFIDLVSDRLQNP